LTALMKLTTRFSEPAQIERIRRTLLSSSTSLDVEIQQRAVEYANLFAYDEVRRGVLEKMPPPEIRDEERVLGERAPKKKVVAGKKKSAKKSDNDMLLDLMGDTPAPAAPTNGTANADLLADLLGGGAPSQPSQPAPQSGASSHADILGLFGSQSAASPAPAPASAPTSAQPPVLVAYQQGGLFVTLQLQHKSAEGLVNVMARFRNVGGSPLSGINLLAAVPRSQKIQLQNISKSELSPGEEATQAIRVAQFTNPPLRLRLKVMYTAGGAAVVDQVDWSEANAARA